MNILCIYSIELFEKVHVSFYLEGISMNAISERLIHTPHFANVWLIHDFCAANNIPTAYAA